MKLNDSRIINATPDKVWNALLSADALKACVPGCQELSGSPEEGFEAVVVQNVGPVKATFKGSVELTDMVEPVSLKISGQGQGGVAGFASGGANVILTPDGEQTILNYDVEAKVGGKLAQLGSRIIDSFAKKMADQFFEKFQNTVEGVPIENKETTQQDYSGGLLEWLKRLFGL